MTDPTIAPAYNEVRESDVTAALKQATIRQLAKALDVGAFTGAHQADGFRCPDCGFWNAIVIDDFRWTCPQCPDDWTSTVSAQRTKFALRTHVAGRYDACLRLVLDVIDPRTMPDVKRTNARTADRKPTGHGGKVLT